MSDLAEMRDGAEESWIVAPGDIVHARMRAAFEAAGVPELLGERRVLGEELRVALDRAERAEASRDTYAAAGMRMASRLREIEAERDAAQKAAREFAKALRQIAACRPLIETPKGTLGIGFEVISRNVLARFPDYGEPKP